MNLSGSQTRYGMVCVMQARSDFLSIPIARRDCSRQVHVQRRESIHRPRARPGLSLE